jgi:hypothetical protein
VKWLKLLIGILLLPACFAFTASLWHLAETGWFTGKPLASQPAIAFGAGYGLWLLVFLVLPKPTRTYVLGHELTHAIWALMMGGRVSGLRVGKTGGQVRTSKTNWFITLAPYFFPFYAMLFIAAFFLVNIGYDLSRYLWVLFFLIGLGWSFHVTFTLMILFTVQQPDVKSQGVIFSAVVIYLMNLLTITITAVALSHTLTFGQLGTTAGKDLWASYRWTLDKCGALWQDTARPLKQTR